MMDEKKVSIVLPVYNGADYLAESIESVLNQTYANWELIVVNDCSTDNTLAIASNYAVRDARIKVFTNKRNLKLPGTLNAGFERATGEYYTWTSDDNKYKPDALRIMVECLEKIPDVVMVYANYTTIDANGNSVALTTKPDSRFIVAGNVVGACFLYRANAAKKVGEYDSNLFLAEDYDYWIRLYKVGKILHIADDLYFYRIHEKSLTETKKKFVDEQTYKALEKNFSFAYTKSVEDNLCNEFFDHMLSRASAHYDRTLKMLVSTNKKYLIHLYWTKFKVFVWNTRLWHLQRRLRGLV